MTIERFDVAPGSTATFRITGFHAETGVFVDVTAMILRPVGFRTVQQVAEELARDMLAGGIATVTWDGRPSD